MKEIPLVSVLVTCYNKERFIEETLNSVCAQTYQNFELIIVDDASTDRSAQVIQEWIDQNKCPCLYIENEENYGLCASTNIALARAQGKYVSLLDGDDLFMPDKLKIQVAEMEKLPESVGVIYSDTYSIDESGKLLEKLGFEMCHIKTPPNGQIFDALARGNFIRPSSTLIRRFCFDQVGNCDESLLNQDWDIFLRIADQFHFHCSSYVSLQYRIVRISMSHQDFKTGYYVETIIRICKKWVNNPKLTKSQKNIFINVMKWFVITSCKKQKPFRRSVLKKAFFCRVDIKFFFCFLLTYFHHSFEKRIYEIYSKMKA